MPVTTRRRTVLVMAPATFDQLFGPEELARLHALADVAEPVCAAAFDQLPPATLAEVEVLITGWGCSEIPERVLEAAPRLRLVLHAAGSARGLLPAAGYRRGVEEDGRAAGRA